MPTAASPSSAAPPSRRAGATIETGALGDFAVTAPEKGQLQFATENGLAAGDLDGDGVDDLALGDGLADDGALAGTGAVLRRLRARRRRRRPRPRVRSRRLRLYGPQRERRHDVRRRAVPGAASRSATSTATGRLDLVARDEAAPYVIVGPLAARDAPLSWPSPGRRRRHRARPGGVLVMDATGDGRADLVLGSQDRVRVIAGPLAAGQTLDAAAAAAFTLTGPEPRSLAAGDLLGDARPELILGDPSARRAYAVPPGDYGPGDVAVDEVAALVVTGSFAAARNLGCGRRRPATSTSTGAPTSSPGPGSSRTPAGTRTSRTSARCSSSTATRRFRRARRVRGRAASPRRAAASRLDERKAGKEKLSLALAKLAAPVGRRGARRPRARAPRATTSASTTRRMRCVAALSVDRAERAAARSRAGRPRAEASPTRIPRRPRTASRSSSPEAARPARGSSRRWRATGRRRARRRSRRASPQRSRASPRRRRRCVASEGACFELRDAGVRKAGPALFDASLP